MEAKDTVMGESTMAAILPKVFDGSLSFGHYSDEKYKCMAIAKAQAEISFKAGYMKGLDNREGAADEEFKAGEQQGIEKGRREVVEWIKANASLERGDYAVGLCFADYLHFDYKDWQTFFKELGVEEL